MEKWNKIDKDRLTVFTDAIMAIIMTILVLDLKVPMGNIETDHDLKEELLKQLPHFWGFAISFSMIVLLWFTHHTLMTIIGEPNRTFTVLNFIFSGTIATLPFTTALVSEYPSHSLAVAILAGNMFLMNFFLSRMYFYVESAKLITSDIRPAWFKNIKRKMGMAGMFLLLSATFIAFLSPKVALMMIIAVPLMHCIPMQALKNRKLKPED